MGSNDSNQFLEPEFFRFSNPYLISAFKELSIIDTKISLNMNMNWDKMKEWIGKAIRIATDLGNNLKTTYSLNASLITVDENSLSKDILLFGVNMLLNSMCGKLLEVSLTSKSIDEKSSLLKDSVANVVGVQIHLLQNKSLFDNFDQLMASVGEMSAITSMLLHSHNCGEAPNA